MLPPLSQEQIQFLSTYNPSMLKQIQTAQKIEAIGGMAIDLLTGGCSIF